MSLDYLIAVNRIGDWQVSGRDDRCRLEWMEIRLWVLVSINCGLVGSCYCTDNEEWLISWLTEGGVG